MGHWGGGYCPFGVVLSPRFSGFIPPLGGGGGLSLFLERRGMAHLYVNHVNLEPQYRNTSSGMEVGGNTSRRHDKWL